MSDEEYEQLENLIDKLASVLGHISICIVNGVTDDGYHMATYNNSGEIYETHIGPTIKDTVKKFKRDTNN